MMNTMQIVSYLYILFNTYLIKQLGYASGVHSLMRKDTTFKKHIDIQSEMVVDYENLDHGEVAWDFPSREIEETYLERDTNVYSYQYYSNEYLNSYQHVLALDTNKRLHITIDPEEIITMDDMNTIYNKYVKNNIIFHIKSRLKMRMKMKTNTQNLYLNEAYSNLIKLIYKDVVKIETVITDIQSFIIESVSGHNIESDIVALILISALGVMYNKTKSESIHNLKQIHTAKKKYEILKNYKKIRRHVGIFFIIMSTILNRNVKNAE